MIDTCYDYFISPSFSILVIIMILLTCFYIWLRTLSVESTQIIIKKKNSLVKKTYECPLGQCPLDIKTGEKIYDIENPVQIYNFNPKTQICAAFDSCTKPPFLIAINSDGSTNNFGECEKNPLTGNPTFCRCSKKPQCPYYNASYFQTTQGNPFQSISNSRTTFSEIGRKPDDYFGINYDNINNSFCQIPVNWLFRTESSVCSSFSYEADPLRAIKSCIQNKPCNYGNIAYLTSNPDEFSKNDLSKFPVACVQSNCLTPGSNHCNISGACDISDPSSNSNEFFVPIFDLRSEILLCKSI
jgi:hypothetical protein